jgi:hypothetical protein
MLQLMEQEELRVWPLLTHRWTALGAEETYQMLLAKKRKKKKVSSEYSPETLCSV